MRTSVVLAALLGLGLLPTAGSAQPAKMSPPACGVHMLPLVQGNTWKYVQVQAPTPIDPQLAKLAPPQAKTVTITVTKLEAKAQDVTVTLEEKMHYELKNPANDKKPLEYDITVNSTIFCNKTKFEVSPDSFFFSSEPGGYRELEFDKFERSRDTSFKFPAANGLGDAPWREDIVAHFKRTPKAGAKVKMGGGKLELERSFQPERPEAVMTTSGNHWAKAEKLALTTTGRITLDEPVSPNPQKSELPANWVTRLWFEPDVGVVQTLNQYAHMFQLDTFTLN